MKPLPLVFNAPKRGLPARHLADLAPAERRVAVAELGEKPYRAEQLARHWFAGHPTEQMTDLPGPLRQRLVDALLPPLLAPVRDVECDDGATRKTLWRGHDGTLVESVLMGYADRTTVCVSSQAGCGMACPFCATGQAGLTRNLSTAEIVEQVVVSNAAEAAAGGRVSNVVFMGSVDHDRSKYTHPPTCGFASRIVVARTKCVAHEGLNGSSRRARRGWRCSNSERRGPQGPANAGVLVTTPRTTG